MKRPSFQFYPADWRKDPALSSCSLAARGLWIELVCVAHESDQYGFLVVNGNPMSSVQIARAVGGDRNEVGALLGELESAGVFSRDERGAIYSRRMVQDEQLRTTRAECGRLGGNPNLLNQKANQTGSKIAGKDNHGIKLVGKVEPTPSSSSSSSSKDLNPLSSTASTEPPAGFVRFWQAYPATRRRVGKAACLRKWLSGALESNAEAIAGHVSAMRDTPQWRGGYEPAPLTYLNQRRWEDGLPEAPPAQRSRGPAL